jgi:hypothetical protein
MDVINAVAAILTIVTSGISIYLFVSERRRRGDRAAARPAPAAAPPCKPKATAESGDGKAGETGSLGGVERTLHKVAAGFWGVLGFACLSEGATYGDGILLLLAGLFFWLAYKLWPTSGAAEA